MNARARQIIPTLPDVEPVDTSAELAAVRAATERTTRLWQLFDSLSEYGYSQMDLFEFSTPGATDALRTWAKTLGYEVVEKSVTPPGAPCVLMLVVRVRKSDGSDGARITVSRYPEAS